MQFTINDDLYAQYRLYAKLRNTTVEKALAYALSDWMESVGQGHIEDTVSIETAQVISQWLSEVDTFNTNSSCVEKQPMVIKQVTKR